MKTGDRIRKRGFKHEGKIAKMDTAWATIEWDDGPMPIERPVMCHIRELEPVEPKTRDLMMDIAFRPGEKAAALKGNSPKFAKEIDGLDWRLLFEKGDS